ncbi:hypothetical protein CAPTEDRAFT_192178 [Capitella teleta]|uniref:MADF domain-containing protein n=1 Tax=Capitella teleta TaxID=283909 RepID=R7TD74_CAPTE|nr:hypothetical protein CAPTEDRAFT_192178 [Capitella teleta]|eukprot:ELT89437.1 hypothetical protein CAPTEDRAFT_192178 [Capitella teleta]
MDNRPKRSMDEAASFEIGSVTSLKEEPTQGEEENEDYEFVSKRRRAPGSLSAANEQHLADWFAEQPCFWDHCDANFRNRGKKERMLAKKAVEVGMTGEDLSSWFKSMRTGYGRLIDVIRYSEYF